MNAGRILALISTLAMATTAPIYGATKYDRTIDGKTKIGQDAPERGLQATWTGERDEHGYATGRGTLTWFRVRHNWETGSQLPGSKYTQVSQYTGKMVEGRLEGQVVVVDAKGRTFHTKFAEGEKAGDWVAGEPNKRKSEEDSTAPKVAAVKPRPSPPAAPPAPAVVSASEPPPPAEAPPPSPKLDQHVASQPAPKLAEQTPPASASQQSPVTTDKSESSLRSLAMPPTSLRVASLQPSAAASPATPDAEETAVSSGSVAAENATTASSPKDDDVRLVAALDSEYHAAVKTNDASTMDRILADDFVFVSGGGPKLTKQDVLNKARANQDKYEHHEVEEGSQNVRVWKDTAVVTETVWVKGSENGTPVDQKMSVTETYARTRDGWRYVSGQATAAPH
jgi:ketosteroid isomerase-like protein